MSGQSLIFQPMDEVYEDPDARRAFEQHYPGESWDSIVGKVYGGCPLADLFGSVEFDATPDQIANLRCDIIVQARAARVSDIRLRNVSMKQFLVSGLPDPSWVPWDGSCHWADVDKQYRFEICRSEISRWSILFKEGGVVQGGAEIEHGDQFSRIEFVNNCTDTRGFELKLVRSGALYHGSFGRDERLNAVYYSLCQRQAGTYAKQNDPLDPPSKNPVFWDAYFNPLQVGASIEIDPTKYRRSSLPTSTDAVPLQIERGKIDYTRWGAGTEYYKKPVERGLVIDVDGSGPRYVPREYREIEAAVDVQLPTFTSSGIYDISAGTHKKKLSLLYELEECRIHRFPDGEFELEFVRDSSSSDFEPRRLVIGNLTPSSIPVFPKYQTLHRFGYGARPTTMPYSPDFRPSSEASPRAPYALILGGIGKAADANRTILPEGYGAERVILSWDESGCRNLTVDIIGFERILPIWQGRIRFPQGTLA